MTVSRNIPAENAGLSRFMLDRVPPLLDAFEKEIEGVRRSDDIEYIHRMRVASRRLRAALPLFRPCFPAKPYGRWMTEIAGVTRALGAARDADVQIAFLQKFQKKCISAWKKRRPDATMEPPESPAIRYLLTQLQKQRSLHQERVLLALDALEKSRVLPEMRSTIARIGSGSTVTKKRLAYALPTVAAFRLETRLVDLLSYEPWVSHPEAVAEHHATRIAAKKLRYTMEIYGPLYRRGLKKPYIRVKRIQEILGDLHDCDVWIDHITRILLRERGRLRTDNEEKRPDTATLSSLKIFLQDREKVRNLLYNQFVRYWESLARAALWKELRTALNSGRKQRFIPPVFHDTAAARTAVTLIASRFPDLLAHEEHVTRLSLMLFDSLRPLHKLGTPDRFLLESAGLLHDLGWEDGRRKHHIRGALAVITDETIPFDIDERSIIALCILSHRGRRSPEHHPLYQLLPDPLRKKTLQLAALLRIADGLDYQHLGNVQEIHAIIDSDVIICDVVSSIDSTIEKEHARVKADLFTKVFERELVIR